MVYIWAEKEPAGLLIRRALCGGEKNEYYLYDKNTFRKFLNFLNIEIISLFSIESNIEVFIISPTFIF